MDIEVVAEDRLVDVVAEGYDAGVRLIEAIERDMVQVRLTEGYRFVVVGAPSYFARRGAPERPEDLMQHECIGFRLASTGTLYAWEFERGRRTWRVPVRGGVITNDGALRLRLAEEGVGLTYVDELAVADPIEAGTLMRVLAPYEACVPGFFLYYPSRAQSSPAFRLFVETARELASPRSRHLASSSTGEGQE